MIHTVNSKASALMVACGISLAATGAFAISGPPVPGKKPAPVAATNDTANSDSANPYAVITDRNIFRLTTPPPPKEPEAKPVELPKVYLGGLMKIGDDIRVLFSIPAKDKTPASYLRLSPGEKQNGVELVKIHPDQQGVDVLVNDTPMTLTMASNSLAKMSGGPAPVAAAAPAAPAAAGGGSAVVIAGRSSRDSSPYGGVAIAGGGGGGAVVGGGGTGSRGSSVAVTGGGGNSLAMNNTINPAVANQMVGNNLPAQLANTLQSGVNGNQTVGSQANNPSGQIVPVNLQAATIAAQAMRDPAMPPLPPNIQNQVNGGGDEDPPPPSLPGQK